MSLFITLQCLISVLVLFLWWIKGFNSQYPQPPKFPGALPLIGHAHMIFGNCLYIWPKIEIVLSYALKVGGTIRCIVASITFYVLSDPEDVSTVLNKCLDKPSLYSIGKEWIGNALLISHVAKWKKDRKMLSPTFTKKELYRFMDMFNSQSRRLVHALKAEIGRGNFDQRKHIFKNVLETINQTTLGIKNEENYVFEENIVHELDDLLGMFVERCLKVWLLVPFFFNRSDLKRRQDKVLNKTKALCEMAIERRKLELQRAGDDIRNSDKVKSILDYLLESMSNSDDCTDDDIRQQLEAIIFGALDTCATTLITVLKLIGLHSQVQNQIFQEITDVFGASDRDVNIEDLTKLSYIEAVIKETIRLYPVVPGVARTASHDVQLKNYVIPSGAPIICAIYNVHRHPSWGEDLELFKPERWLGPKPPPANLFVGFSSGRRGCIGEHYALMTMKTIMVHLVRQYIITSDHTKPVFKYNIMLKPVSGYEISIKLRS